MADTPGPAPHLLALYEALTAEPYRHGFVSVLRRIECAHRHLPRLGHSVAVREDPVRLGQEPSMAFAPSTLASFKIDEEGRAPKLEVFFFGVFGPNGPLPLHLTEYARGRIRHAGDPTFADFANLFHHRMLSLFYRAATAAQPAVDYDRPEQSRFRGYIGSLFGIGGEALRHRDAFPDAAKLHYAGWLSGQSRNPEGLRSMIAHFLRMPVELEEFVGEWLPLPEAGICRFGADPETGLLGVNMIIGERIWAGQQKFRLRVGPVSYADYQRLLPGGDTLRRLVALVRNYFGDELNWDLNLVLRKAEVPPLRLGEATRLGWSTWLKGPPPLADPADLKLNVLARI